MTTLALLHPTTPIASFRGASRAARAVVSRAPLRVVAGKRSRRPKAEKRSDGTPDVAVPTVGTAPAETAPASQPPVPGDGASPTADPSIDEPLPAATRDQLLDSCLGTWFLQMAKPAPFQ